MLIPKRNQEELITNVKVKCTENYIIPNANFV